MPGRGQGQRCGICPRGTGVQAADWLPRQDEGTSRIEVNERVFTILPGHPVARSDFREEFSLFASDLDSVEQVSVLINLKLTP